MDRLFQIVYYLLEKGKSSAPELAKKFELSDLLRWYPNF